MNTITIPSECIRTRNDPRISFHKRKCSILFENINRREVYEIRIDCCVICDGVKCDYLLLDPGGNPKEHFIELKGKNVIHAIEQITETIIKISEDSRSLLKNCWIICTQNPLDSTQVQIYKRRLRESHNAILEIHRLTHTVILQ